MGNGGVQRKRRLEPNLVFENMVFLGTGGKTHRIIKDPVSRGFFQALRAQKKETHVCKEES